MVLICMCVVKYGCWYVRPVKVCMGVLKPLDSGFKRFQTLVYVCVFMYVCVGMYLCALRYVGGCV